MLVKLCDFGLSQIGSQPYQYKGTQGYIDPRTIATRTSYNQASDLWNLGVSLLCAFCDYKHIEDLKKKSYDSLDVPALLEKMNIPNTTLGSLIRILFAEQTSHSAFVKCIDLIQNVPSSGSVSLVQLLKTSGFESGN